MQRVGFSAFQNHDSEENQVKTVTADFPPQVRIPRAMSDWQIGGGEELAAAGCVLWPSKLVNPETRRLGTRVQGRDPFRFREEERLGG